MNMQSKIVVTAAEFTRQFGQLRQTLGEAPVHVTHHGRETHVLLSRARYEAMRMLDAREAQAPALPELHTLADYLPTAVLVVRADETVAFANSAGHAMLARPIGELVGRPLSEAVPAVADTLLEAYLRRALASGEAHVADLPSPVREGAWLRVEIRPSAERAMVLLHDITDDVTRHRRADRARAIAAAVGAHAGIGEIHVNLRGFIEAIDERTCVRLALPAARLEGVALVDLIPASGRVAVREQLDRVLRGGGPATVSCALLTNGGTLLPISGVLMELSGIYGAEGAVLVLTDGTPQPTSTGAPQRAPSTQTSA